jgi:hypothetical protein
MKVYDCFKREITVGCFLAAATMSFKRRSIRVGKVIKIHKSGKITIDTGSKLHSWSTTTLSVINGGYESCIIDPSSLPSEVLGKFAIGVWHFQRR